MDNNKELLNSSNIKNLLFKLSFPATIAMIVNALYNIVDTVFIGRGIGTLAIAGVAIQLPIQIIILSFGLFIGVGASSMLSRYLGKKDFEKVNYIACNSFLCIGIIGLFFSIFGYIFCDSIVVLFGATKNIFPYARDYVKIMFIGSLYFPFCVSTNNLIRSEGNSKNAMISMIIGFLSNLLLDYLFIFIFHMGIKGAAIATILSKLASFIYIIFYLNSSKTHIKISLKYFVPQKYIIKELLSIGFSAFAVQISSSIVTIILNHILASLGGDISIAVYGIVYKITLFLFMPIHGMVQGMQPIIGYNYGSKNMCKVKETIKLTLIYSTLITTIGVFIGEIFSYEIISLFNKNTILILQGIKALRIVIIATPLLGIQMTGLGFFQSLGKPLTSFILSILRQILLFIPLALILPNVCNLNLLGVWLAFPISDFLSVIITIFIFKKELNLLTMKNASSL